MTDPTLAALLDDPDPDARLIAADYAALMGEEVSEAALRLTAVLLALPGWQFGGQGSTEDWVICLQHPSGHGGARLDALSRKKGDSTIWTRTMGGRWSRRHSFNLMAPQEEMPPPGLEAAVLAVLRARLAERRRG